jgi:hypothetical protein
MLAVCGVLNTQDRPAALRGPSSWQKRPHRYNHSSLVGHILFSRLPSCSFISLESSGIQSLHLLPSLFIYFPCSCIAAFLYPGYASFKTLSQRPASEEDLERWLMYWSVLACVVGVEYLAEWLVSWCALRDSSCQQCRSPQYLLSLPS